MDDSIESDWSNDPSATNTRGISAFETWQHARTANENEAKEVKGRPLWYCRHCSPASPSSSVYCTPITTNFRRHLSTKHNIDTSPQTSKIEEEISNQFAKLWSKAKENNHTTQIGGHVFQDYLREDVINEALVSLITVQNLSSRLIESPEFHSFCLALNPSASDVLSRAHSTIPKLIESSFQISKDIVRRKVQSAMSRIHVSLDIWTSPNQHSFLAVVGHFVDIDKKRQDALLALRAISNHSGEEQARVLISILQDYGIVQDLGVIMGDNASNNNTLCRGMSKYLKDEGLEWDPKQERLRCLGHIINLIVQAFLFHDYFEIEELCAYDQEESGLAADAPERQSRAKSFRRMGPLGKLHNIVVHTRGSAHRTKEFISLAGRKIPLDNRTRWNSWYQMVLAATENEAAIDTYTKSHYSDLNKEFLAPKDWMFLRTIQDFLQPFHQATLVTEGKSGTLDKVLNTMDILRKVFQMVKVFFFI